MQLHWHIWEPNLTDYELDRLVDFLGTLTDETFKPQIPKRLPSGLTPQDHLPSNAIVDIKITVEGES